VLGNRAFEGSSTKHPVEGEIDLWIANAHDTTDSLTVYRHLLSQDELDRASHFKFDHLSDFYIFCRGTLRRILSRYLGIPGDTVRFRYGEMGKPFLETPTDLQFNVSHSGDLFVCAVSSGMIIGVDVEEIRPIDDMTAIASHFFSPAEQRHLASLAEADRTHAFYECWTRKEAVIKATGEGVSRPLDSFEVAFGPATTPRLLRIDNEPSPSWKMDSFEPGLGYIGAVTSPCAWSSIRVWDINLE
jgi:4'-phosphopantetheinyl transferase